MDYLSIEILHENAHAAVGKELLHVFHLVEGREKTSDAPTLYVYDW